MSQDLLQAMPFLAGIALIFAQSTFDQAWKANFEKTYQAERLDVAGGAEWVANVAAFLPNAVLTTVGALYLAVDQESASRWVVPWVYWGVAAFVSVSFGLYLFEAHRGKPARAPWLFGRFDKLQLWLLVLNNAGVVLAFVTN